MPPSVTESPVDDVEQRLASAPAAQVLDEGLDQELQSARHAPRDVRGEADARVVVQPVAGGEGLRIDTVERRQGDAALVQGGAQGALVDEVASRDVDEVDARLHARKRIGAEDAPGLGRVGKNAAGARSTRRPARQVTMNREADTTPAAAQNGAGSSPPRLRLAMRNVVKSFPGESPRLSQLTRMGADMVEGAGKPAVPGPEKKPETDGARPDWV